MNWKKIAIPLLNGFFLAFAAQNSHAISLDFTSLIGAKIQFTGDTDTFQFVNNTSGNSFKINLSDGVGDSLGLSGNISGTFTIGPISIDGLDQSASVTSSSGARLTINDGATPFSGAIDWISIHTLGTGGDLNLTGLVNLTDITYLGTKSDLIALMGDSASASATVAFTFNPAKSLTDLTLDGTVSKTSFTGDLTSVSTSVPDGGMTAILLGMVFTGFALFQQRRSLQ